MASGTDQRVFTLPAWWLILLASLFQVKDIEAQWVSYSEPTGFTHGGKEWLAGKAGDYYWLLKSTPSLPTQKPIDALREWPLHWFEIYDSRLRYFRRLQNSRLPYPISKLYVVAGEAYMDLLCFSEDTGSVKVHRRRYAPAGDFLSDSVLATFPFREPAHRFVVCRSENQQRLLLLGFESVEDATPNVHAILIAEPGCLLAQQVYHDPSLTQPVIQDDEINRPAEHYANTPVQLLNSGEWITIMSSRTALAFQLFHFSDSGYVRRSIRMPPKTTLEDLALTVNNIRKTASAGFLSRFTFRSLKNVQVVRYDLGKKEVLLDTSYRFNALLGDKIQSKNIIKEHLTAVPGTGFVLLREYGLVFEHLLDGPALPEQSGKEMIADYGLSRNEEAPNESTLTTYSRSPRLGGLRTTFDRGDLSIFFFPSLPGDSCWSGLIHKPQYTENNAPYLSYLMVPIRGHLHILSNDFYSPWKQMGSATVLDEKGRLREGEGTVFWRYRNVLVFQEAVPLRANEIGVPFRMNERTGFSVLRF